LNRISALFSLGIKGVARIAYPLRIIGYNLAAVILIIARIDIDKFDAPSMFAAFTLVAYPHLIYFINRRFDSSKQVEKWAQKGDLFLSGILISFLHFSLFPTLAFSTMAMSSYLSVYGFKRFYEVLIAIAIGILVILPFEGLEVADRNSFTVNILSGLFLAMYSIIYAITNYNWAKKLIATRKDLSKQKEDIEKQRDQLLQINQEKNSLISIVSHDLKSPLQQMKGMITLLELEGNNFTPDQKKYLQMMTQSSDRLLSMVSRILDVESIDKRKLTLELESVVMDKFIKDLIPYYQTLANAKDIRIHYQCANPLLAVATDTNYLKPIIDNLVSNAIKFSPRERNIYLRLNQSGSFVRLSVIDEGPGISPEDEEKLFQKFAKLSNKPTAGESSSGLGLSIVRKYAEAMGGVVRYKRQRKPGSWFVVELPLTEEKEGRIIKKNQG
jgi:signal transduction histidine kinase